MFTDGLHTALVGRFINALAGQLQLCVVFAGIVLASAVPNYDPPVVFEPRCCVSCVSGTADTCSLCVCCSGYDYINRAETTSAEFFAENGYDTAHFGKW
jgi:hypothetical protein